MDRSARLSRSLRLREKSHLAKAQRRPAPIKARARKRRRLVVRTLLTTFIISLVSAAIFFVASYERYEATKKIAAETSEIMNVVSRVLTTSRRRFLARALIGAGRLCAFARCDFSRRRKDLERRAERSISSIRCSYEMTNEGGFLEGTRTASGEFCAASEQ